MGVGFKVFCFMVIAVCQVTYQIQRSLVGGIILIPTP